LSFRDPRRFKGVPAPKMGEGTPFFIPFLDKPRLPAYHRTEMTHAGTWMTEVKEALRAASKVVVLGIGNPDRADDGAGVAAAGALARRLAPARKRRVRIMIGGPVPESLTGKIRTFRPGLVVILDSAVGGLPPGSFYRVDPEKIADDGVTTHRISLRWLVRYIEESIGCPSIVLGIEPETLEFGGGLSAAVQKGISTAVDFLVENLSLAVRRRPA
jgi:hydrogenase maturation protease